MADIYSGPGRPVERAPEGWLVVLHEQVRGPFTYNVLAAKVLKGAIRKSALVARVGGEFGPLEREPAFAALLQQLAERAVRRRRRRWWGAAVVTLGGVALAVALDGRWHQGGGAAGEQVAAPAAAPGGGSSSAPGDGPGGPGGAGAGAREAGAAEPVSGTPASSVTPAPPEPAEPAAATAEPVRSAERFAKPRGARAASPGARAAATAPSSAAEAEPIMRTCELAQAEILQTVRRHQEAIARCIAAEKKRDVQGLLPASLEVAWVVLPSGKTRDFFIAERPYREGPLYDCLAQVWGAMVFAASGGSNCPVTLPLKIAR